MEISKIDVNDKDFEFVTSREFKSFEDEDKDFWKERKFWQGLYTPSKFETPEYVEKNAVVSAEIKISIAENSLEEILKHIQKIGDACKSDCKFSVNIEG